MVLEGTHGKTDVAGNTTGTNVIGVILVIGTTTVLIVEGGIIALSTVGNASKRMARIEIIHALHHLERETVRRSIGIKQLIFSFCLPVCCILNIVI